MPIHKIIKVQQFDKNIPIEFYSIEEHPELFDFDYHYQYNFYQIYWFTSTCAQRQEIDFKSYPITQNQLWVVFPGQVQFFNPTHVTGYYMAIDKDYFNRIIYQEVAEHDYYKIPPLHFEITPDLIPIFQSIFQLINIEWSTKRRTAIMEKYVSLFLCHTLDLKQLSDTVSNYDPRVYKLLNLVELHYCSQYSNEFYASSVSLSIKRMNEILVNTTGDTLNIHLKNRLLLEAKRMLIYSDLTVQQIAFSLGYSEVNYFNRFFKKNTSVTPSEFRKNIKKVQ
ncbi:helix-turn-helix domain-containing protein [Myroides albus]|uniref:helix-turn-helix domain-containing protein n=1 Tax=Myroides albus TaxID=2562892 RepID=UPI0021591A10|nr:helix-turn-helix domain-containing protein [Myroides albus]UVD79285.1 helix-turn-helix domain-containing protein [Myroides albus]